MKVNLDQISEPRRVFRTHLGVDAYLPKRKTKCRHKVLSLVENHYHVKFIADNGSQLIFMLLPKPVPNKAETKDINHGGEYFIRNDSGFKQKKWLQTEIHDLIGSLEFVFNDGRDDEARRQIVVLELKRGRVKSQG